MKEGASSGIRCMTRSSETEGAAFYPGKIAFPIRGDIARLRDHLAMDARFDVAFRFRGNAGSPTDGQPSKLCATLALRGGCAWTALS
jgi:hypothetical protein